MRLADGLDGEGAVDDGAEVAAALMARQGADDVRLVAVGLAADGGLAVTIVTECAAPQLDAACLVDGPAAVLGCGIATGSRPCLRLM